MRRKTNIEIIEGCIAKDRLSQKALVMRYSSTLLAVSRRYTSNEHNAQDVVQEGFIKILRSIDSYKDMGSFEAWMKRIIINTAINSTSRKRVKYEVNANEEAFEIEVPAKAYSNMNADELMKLINTLPQGYKEVFNLSAIEGYTHVEIGEILNISPSTSRSQLTRARKMLQSKLIQLEKISA